MKKKLKKGKEKFEIYKWIGVYIFFFGILLVIKTAYDYTVIKNNCGILFCFFLSLYFYLTNKPFEFSNFDFLPITFFSYLLISSFYAPYKFESAKVLENFYLYFLIYIVTSNLEFDKRFLYIWIGTGIIASIIGIFNFIEKRYAISTFGNPNFFAGHLIMILSLSISNILNKRNEDFYFYLDIFCLIFGFISLILTKSRAAIMGFIIGCAFIWYFKNFDKKGIVKFVGLYFLIVLILSFSPKIINWYLNDIRYYIWRGTWRLILKKIYFGWGLGNFIIFYPYFRVREYFLRPEATPVTNHPHNEYLEIWSETGILGLLLFITFIIFLIIGAIKKVKEEYRVYIPGILGGIIAVVADNIFSTNLRNPSTSMYFWFMLGILSYFLKKNKINFKISKYLWISIITITFIFSIYHSIYRFLPHVYYKKGVIAKDMGKYLESIENYSIGCKLNPYNYELWYKLAYVYGMIDNYKKAEEIYIHINTYLFPHFAKTDANLGTVYLKLGDIEKAFKYYKIAEWLNPYDEDVLCSIASIYLVWYNNYKEAERYLRRVLRLNPKNIYANRTLELMKRQGKIK